MSRDARAFWSVLLSCLTLMPGCAPSRTFYFHENGELNYYKGMASNIEYPDVEGATLAEVSNSLPPATLRNIEDYQFWDLCLQDAVQTALSNSKVIRLLNGGAAGTPDRLVSTAGQGVSSAAPSVYDYALQQTNPGNGRTPIGGLGPEAALSAFDATINASMLWQHNEQPRNVRFNPAIQQIFARDFLQDTATFQAELAKQTASGTRFAISNQTIYDSNNNPTRDVISDYTEVLQVEARQPFLQGNGVLFNRIAGPNAVAGNYNGVMIARIEGDISLADFEAQVLNQVKQVEDVYWSLYEAYRLFDAARTGRDAVLQAWRRVEALRQVGALGGGALDEARARQEYLLFKSQTEDALRALYERENRLRYLMGLAPTDGRLIRPCDEPTTAKIDFDWCLIQSEALSRHVSLRRQKWTIKRAEMRLIAARNFLLPRLDGVARYRWRGLGDTLIDPNGVGIDPQNFTIAGTNAFSTLTDGNYQEWDLGLQFNMTIGFRRELAAVRNAQLDLAKERAVLQDQELEIMHLLSDSIRNLYSNHAIAETLFNRGIAARREVEAAQAIFDEGAELQTQGVSILDRLLDAQRRRAQAEADYFQRLVRYANSISDVHFRKGSLLEYNNVFLAEGPWPCKAYKDALDLARERDASHRLNYGYTRPSVVSRGPYDQFGGQNVGRDASLMPTPAEQVPPPRPREDMPAPGMEQMQPEPSVLRPDTGPRFGVNFGMPTPVEPSLPGPQPPALPTGPMVDAGPAVDSSSGTPSRPIGFRPPRPRP